MTATYDDYRRNAPALEKMTQERTVDEGTFAAQVGKTQYLLSKLNESRTVMLYTIYMVLDRNSTSAPHDSRSALGRAAGHRPADVVTLMVRALLAPTPIAA
jgi:hypothetical protein